MDAPLDARRIGVYEKALPEGAWADIVAAAVSSGFDFLEMSVDESTTRLERLTWTRSQRRQVASICANAGLPVFSLCLSAHRRFGLGSADSVVRARAATILDDAIGVAADLGIRVIQIAGYYAYYEPPDPAARLRYLDGLAHGLRAAAQRGVMLAVENIDTTDTADAAAVLAVIRELDSPWFQAYPDAGNFAVHGLDVAANLSAVLPHSIGVHLKDARPGEPRRVAYGAGTVPFDQVCTVLSESAYRGPVTLEMWNDDQVTAAAKARDALAWIKGRLAAAGGATVG